MLLTGLLQGVLCYLLMARLVPQNSDWLFYGMPATIALSSMLLLTVVSFKQRALWGWLGLIFVVVLAMSGWLKWQVEAVEKWRLAELLWLYGLRLVLMAMLVLPRCNISYIRKPVRRVISSFICGYGITY